MDYKSFLRKIEDRLSSQGNPNFAGDIRRNDTTVAMYDELVKRGVVTSSGGIYAFTLAEDSPAFRNVWEECWETLISNGVI